MKFFPVDPKYIRIQLKQIKFNYIIKRPHINFKNTFNKQDKGW